MSIAILEALTGCTVNGTDPEVRGCVRLVAPCGLNCVPCTLQPVSHFNGDLEVAL